MNSPIRHARPLLAAACLGLLLGPVALALPIGPQPLPETPPQSGMSASFAELDRNNDGLITQDELPPDHELATNFSQWDQDGTGALSRAEFERYLHGESALAEAEDEDDDGAEPPAE